MMEGCQGIIASNKQPEDFWSLPEELVILVFSHLTPRDLCAVAGVCKEWNRWSKEASIWRELLLKTIPEAASPVGYDFYRTFRFLNTLSWKKLKLTCSTDSPVNYSSHSDCVWKNFYVSFGGFRGAGLCAPSVFAVDLSSIDDAKFLRFHPADSSLRKEALLTEEDRPSSEPSPPPVSDHRAVLVGSRYFVFGGWNSDGPSLFINYFDFDEEKWHLRVCEGVKRSRHSATLLQDKKTVLIFGGQGIETTDLTRHTQTNILDSGVLFDTESLKISPVVTTGTPPAPRMCHSATLIGSRLYIFGGDNNVDQIDEESPMHVLDTETMEWSTIPAAGTPPPMLSDHSAVRFEHFLIIFGGATQVNKKYVPSNAVYVFDTKLAVWFRPQVHGDPPAPRRWHSAANVENRHMAVFGGTNISSQESMYLLRWSDGM
mmetsp:Transcript_8151/g.20522  ORF Transcript_8151/g.20522 Transcript_8151/m.20522 type:complete len:429 (-) Transcript_8151:219-1505(-)